MYEVDLNQNWLPLVPQSMTNFPQPQITRDFSYGACDPNLSSEAQIPLDRVMTVIQSRNKTQLDSILESFRLPREGTFEEKVKRLTWTGVQVSLSGLNKNFVTLPGKSDGAFRAYCKHGICIAMLPTVYAEGPAHYCQIVKTFKTMPSFVVCDIAPVVAAHTNAYYPQTFKPHGSRIWDPNDALSCVM